TPRRRAMAGHVSGSCHRATSCASSGWFTNIYVLRTKIEDSCGVMGLARADNSASLWKVCSDALVGPTAMNMMNTTTPIRVIKIGLPRVGPLMVSSGTRFRDGRSTVALRPPLGLGRLRSRQRDRDDEGLPLWLHALLLQAAA